MNLLFYILSILFSYTVKEEQTLTSGFVFSNDVGITCAVFGCTENHSKTWNGLTIIKK